MNAVIFIPDKWKQEGVCFLTRMRVAGKAVVQQKGIAFTVVAVAFIFKIPVGREHNKIGFMGIAVILGPDKKEEIVFGE